MSKIKQIPRHLNRIAHVELERGLNVEAREVTLSLSSEMPIQDFPGEFAILDHGIDSVMLERLNTASPKPHRSRRAGARFKRGGSRSHAFAFV